MHRFWTKNWLLWFSFLGENKNRLVGKLVKIEQKVFFF